MDKNVSMLDFLRQCPAIKANPLFFNFGKVKDNAFQVGTQSSEIKLQKPYIDGSVLKRYTYNLDTYKSVAYNPNIDGLPDENIEDIAEVQEVIDWINDMGDECSFPDFGTECVIDSMQTLSTTPVLVGVDTTLNPAIAIYRIAIQIDYIDNTKRIWS